MRFLHVSDLHIGRRLNGFSMLDDQKDMLGQIVEMAADCDAVLLAGDLYDKAQPSAEAIRTVSDFLVALSRLDKPVFAVSGNHDTPEQVAYCRQLLEHSGVFVASAFEGSISGHVVEDEYGKICVWLLPFVRPASVRPFFPDVHTYEDAVRAAISTADLESETRHVLVAHQYVSGASICESETRLIGGVDQVGADVFEGFDYVALGHLHSPQKLCGGRIAYCGSPLKYSLSEERQRKAALVVEVGAKGQIVLEERPIIPRRDLRTVTGTLEELCDPQKYSEDYVYAVLTDESMLLDPLGALRLTYPHLIGIRLPNSQNGDQEMEMEEAAAESLSPLEHFCAFYEAQNGGKLPDEKRMAVMKRIIEEAEGVQHATDLA